MAIDFPASPSNGQTHTVGSTTWTWDGTKWGITSGAAGATDKIQEGNTSAEVIDTGSDGRFVVTTEGTEALRVDSSRRLLVGTSSARANFYNGTFSPQLQVEGVGDQASSLGITRNQNGSPAYLVLGSTRGTSVGSTTVLQNNDSPGYITFQGMDGAEFVEAGRIACEIDGTPGANDMPGRLVFATTADGAASPTERMRITNDGHVLIGNTSNTSSPSDGFQIYSASQNSQINIGHGNGASSGNGYLRFLYNSGVIGSISQNGTTGVSYNTSSDYRLKENVTLLTGATDRLKQLPVHRFNFIAEPGKTVDGFLAHEAAEVVPECVTGDKDAVDDEGNPIYQGIDQSKLVPLLTAALQEAVARIEAQDTTIASQAATIAAIEARLTALEGGN